MGRGGTRCGLFDLEIRCNVRNLCSQRQTPLRITRRVVMSFVYLVCHGERGIVQSWVDVWGFGLGAGHGKKRAYGMEALLYLLHYSYNKNRRIIHKA